MNAIGAVLLAAAGLMAGLYGAQILRRQERRARQLCRLLELMQFELERFKTPLPELFSSLADRTDEAASELCRRAFSAMQAEDIRFHTAWAFACRALSGHEREIVLPLGEVLGRYGEKEQAAALAAALAQMSRYGEELKTSLREKCRLCVGLSAAGGLLAAVLLW